MKDAYTILTVNPGSTGTKLGLVRGDRILLDLNVDTPKGMFQDCPNFEDQVPKREQMIWDMLREAGVELESIDAVSGRGVGVHS